MSLGANFSSGYTESLQEKQNVCAVHPVIIQTCLPCKTESPGPQPNTQTCSMALLGKICPPPTPEQFALYPKVAIPSSIRTQGIIDKVLDSSQRFSQYRRYIPPVPCPPLPPTMAGISQPSSKRC